MDWLRLAFGLIRDAVETEAAPPPRPAPEAQTGTDIESRLAEHRAQIDRNLEAVVHMLNAQNAKLAESSRRQRIWNISLGAGLGVTLLIALLALMYAVR